MGSSREFKRILIAKNEREMLIGMRHKVSIPLLDSAVKYVSNL